MIENLTRSELSVLRLLRRRGPLRKWQIVRQRRRVKIPLYEKALSNCVINELVGVIHRPALRSDCDRVVIYDLTEKGASIADQT